MLNFHVQNDFTGMIIGGRNSERRAHMKERLMSLMSLVHIDMGEHNHCLCSQSMTKSREVVAVLADAPKEPVVYVPQVVAENDVDTLI